MFRDDLVLPVKHPRPHGTASLLPPMTVGQRGELQAQKNHELRTIYWKEQ